MNIITKTSMLILLGLAFTVSQPFAQDSTKGHSDYKHKYQNSEQEVMGHQHMNMDSIKSAHKHINMKDHKNMIMNKKQDGEESIVRKGKIDLQAIDKNKDGKVYQDMMDWNVISDEPGKCPICEMTLKEVTINEAKYNLYKNGFEVKDY